MHQGAAIEEIGRHAKHHKAQTQRKDYVVQYKHQRKADGCADGDYYQIVKKQPPKTVQRGFKSVFKGFCDFLPRNQPARQPESKNIHPYRAQHQSEQNRDDRACNADIDKKQKRAPYDRRDNNRIYHYSGNHSQKVVPQRIYELAEIRPGIKAAVVCGHEFVETVKRRQIGHARQKIEQSRRHDEKHDGKREVACEIGHKLEKVFDCPEKLFDCFAESGSGNFAVEQIENAVYHAGKRVRYKKN